MARQTINNLESAATVRNKINTNFTELYDYKADKNHAVADNSNGAASYELFGHVKINPANGLTVNEGVLNIAIATTTNAGAVRIADSLDVDDSSRVLSASQGKILGNAVQALQDNTPPKNHAVVSDEYGLATDLLYGHIKVTQGNGLTLNNGVLSLVGASTSSAGGVRLVDTLDSSSTTMALTANMGRYLNEHKAEVYSGTTAPNNNIGQNGDIYFLL